MKNHTADFSARERKNKACSLLSAMLLMMAYGFFNAIPGFFMEAVTESIECTRTAYSFHFTIVSIFALFTAPFFGRHISDPEKMKKLIIFGALTGAVSYAVAAGAKGILSIYIAACLLGFVANNSSMVCAVVILENYFPGKNGGLTGVVMASTGIASALAGLLFPWAIENYGWRASYIIAALLWMCMLLSARFIIGNLAWNNQQEPNLQQKQKQLHGDQVPLCKLCVFTTVVLIVCMNMVFAQHMPAFYVELGYHKSSAGYICSLFSITLIFSKIFIGLLYDKLGARQTTLLCCAGYAVGMWLQAYSNRVPSILMVGVVVSSLGHVMPNVLLPLLTKQIFGAKYYTAIWGFLSGCSMMGFAVGSPLWGKVYDAFGSYKIAVFIAPFTIIVAGTIVFSLVKRAKQKS